MNEPERHKLTPEMEKLLKDSSCQLTLCGGINIGLKTTPMKWLIVSDHEEDKIIARNNDLRKIAELSKENHYLKEKLETK